jgi:hypothetical protein
MKGADMREGADGRVGLVSTGVQNSNNPSQITTVPIISFHKGARNQIDENTGHQN